MPQDIQQNIKIEVTSSGLTETVSSLERLEQAIKNATKYAAQLKSSLSSLSSVKFTSKFANDMESQFKKATNSANKAKNTIESTLSSVSAPALATAATTPASSFKSTSSDLNKANTSTKALDNSMSSLEKTTKKVVTNAKDATWNFFRFRAIAAAALAGVGILGAGILKWYQLSSDYAEANHLLYATLAGSMEKVADAEKTAGLTALDMYGNVIKMDDGVTDATIQVTDAVAEAVTRIREMGSSLGLFSTDLNRTFATFYEMGNSAGMLSNDLAKVSVGMTQLTYDLSSLWDIPFSETAGRLQSALAGNTTAVKSLGIDISRTAADAWLLNNGIDATYNSLDRASKMIVIYNMLMEKTATAHGDLAASAMQPANMLRILGEQAKDAASKLGGALFPLLTQLIPIAVAIANALGKAATALSSFLGIKLGATYTDSFNQWNDFMGSLGGSASSASAGVASVGDSISTLSTTAAASSDGIATLSAGIDTADASFSSLGSEASSAIQTLSTFDSSVTDMGDSINSLSVDEPLNSLTDLSNTVQDISASPLSIDETNAVQPLDTVTDAAEGTLDALEEIKNFQLGFDELHVMPEVPETGGSGGGGGGSGGGGSSGASGIVAIDPYEMDDTVLEQILKRAQEQLEALAAWIDKVFGEGTWEQIQATVNQVIDSIIRNFGKLIEAIGALLLAFIGLFDWPALIKGFGDGFDTVLTVITEVHTWVMKLIAAFMGFDSVQEIFHNLSYPIGLVLGGMTALATVTLGARGAFKLLSMVVSPLGGIFNLAKDSINKTKTSIENLGKAIQIVFSGGTIGAAIAALGGPFEKAAVSIGNLTTKLTPVLSTALGVVVGALTGFLSQFAPVKALADAMGASFESAGTKIFDFGTKLSTTGGIAGLFSGIISKIGLVFVSLNPYVLIAVGVLTALAGAFTFVYNESETFRKTVSDALQGVQDRFNAVKEALQPFFDTFFEAVEGLVEKITGANVTIDDFGQAWEAIKSVLASILEPILTPLVNILGGLVQILITVGGIILSVVVAAFTMLVDVVGSVFQAISGFGELILGLGEIVVGFFTGDWDLVGQGIAKVGEGFGNLVLGIVDAVTSIIDGPLQWLGDALGIEMPDVSEMATGAIRDLGNFLTDTFAPDVAYAAETTDESFQNIEDSATEHSENAEASASESWDAIRESITGNASDAAASADESWTDLLESTDYSMSGISENVGTTWTGVENDVSTHAMNAQMAAAEQWSNIVAATSDFMTRAANAVSDIWNQIVNTISELATNAMNTVRNIWNGIVSLTNDLLTQAWTAVSSIFNNILSSITSVMDSVVSAVRSAWDTVSGILSNIGSAVSSGLSAVGNLVSGVSTMSMSMSYSVSPMSAGPSVGWYATGGIFTKPSIIGLAEAGNEAVVPLSGARMRPFAQTIAMELRADNRATSVNSRNDSAFITAVSTAVYNAMINGFPDEIKGDVYLDSEKVGDSLRRKDRQRGIGTSLVRSM